MNSPTKNGFTLVEVLIALAITSMLISVLMSTLFYIFKVQDSLHHETATREEKLRGWSWFRIAVSGCLPLDKNNPRAFKGTSNKIHCESNTPIIPSLHSVPLEISFHIDSRDKEIVELSYSQLNRAQPLPLPIQRWATSQAQFKYTDSEGQDQDQWPPPSKTNYEALPQLVKLFVGSPGDQQMIWIAPLGADPWLPKAQQLPPGLTPEMFK
jgi:prepilin-type N-terminal cleavage/methylation domain-containing protein